MADMKLDVCRPLQGVIEIKLADTLIPLSLILTNCYLPLSEALAA
jgi:hypothetical protein